MAASTSEEAEEDACETEQETPEQGTLDIEEEKPPEHLNYYPAVEKSKKLPTIGFIQSEEP